MIPHAGADGRGRPKVLRFASPRGSTTHGISIAISKFILTSFRTCGFATSRMRFGPLRTIRDAMVSKAPERKSASARYLNADSSEGGCRVGPALSFDSIMSIITELDTRSYSTIPSYLSALASAQDREKASTTVGVIRE